MATENGMWSFAPMAPALSQIKLSHSPRIGKELPFRTIGIATHVVPTVICESQ